MRFVIQIFDDADLAFRVFGAELRTVLSTTTVLADKPLRLSGRAIAQRFSALALSGHPNRTHVCPLLDQSGQRWILARDGLSAFDPTATLAVRCSNGFDAGFSPYQSARLSR